jgi:hypothetical protein
VLEVPGDQGQIDSRRDEYRRGHPAFGCRRPQQPAAGERDQQERPGQPEPDADTVQRLERLRVAAADAEEVVRALAAARASGIEEQRGQDPQHQNRPAVGGRDGDPVQAGPQAPARVDQRRMADQGRAGGVQHQAGGERQGHPDARVVPSGQEPHQAGRHQQRPEAAGWPPSPRGQAGAEQAPPGHQPGQFSGKGAAGERVGRLCVGNCQRQPPQRQPHGKQREPSGAPEPNLSGDHERIVASAATRAQHRHAQMSASLGAAEGCP